MGQAVEPALPANVGVPPETPTPTSVPGQVIRAITLQWRQGVGEARIQLQPEHLGHVTVNLRVEGGTVTATLRAETQAVSDQIQAQQHQLRTALEQQGLTLGRLLVRVDPEGRRQQRAPWHDEPPRRPRHAAVTTTPLFEIEV
jgi:flagellar hook-length control protein FliK